MDIFWNNTLCSLNEHTLLNTVWITITWRLVKLFSVVILYLNSCIQVSVLQPLCFTWTYQSGFWPKSYHRYHLLNIENLVKYTHTDVQETGLSKLYFPTFVNISLWPWNLSFSHVFFYDNFSPLIMQTLLWRLDMPGWWYGGISLCNLNPYNLIFKR